MMGGIFETLGIVVIVLFLSETSALTSRASVIVIGAGISGISTAKSLTDAGISNFLILEATSRIGGRIHKQDFAGSSIEIGANWVEGVDGKQINPIWTIAKEINLNTFCSNFGNITSNIYKERGGLYEHNKVQVAFQNARIQWEYSERLAKILSLQGDKDISILTSQRLYNYVPSTPLEMAIDYFNYDYQFAEPPRVTSLKNTEPILTFSDFGEDLYFVADPRGYESVVHHIASQFLAVDKAGNITDPRLQLNKVVTEIHHSDTGVIVKTQDGSVYRADYVMVSASIGVLQTKLINFQPELPRWKVLAIDQFDMSVFTKIFLKFPYKFWPTGNGTEFFVYAHEKRGYYTIWQQLDREYPGANVLFVTATDDESKRIEQQPDSETKAEIMEILRNMFGKDIPEATDILIPRWWSNRFYKGTYSNWPIGVSGLEFDQIRAPVGRVYFTGEHTSKQYTGYVHGAYLAGIDSANMLINCVKKGMCQSPYQAQRDLNQMLSFSA